jgi:outer membrane protein assembly factor BamB
MRLSIRAPGLHLSALVSALAIAWSTMASAADWPRFRGPDGSGTAAAQNLPVRWDEDTNVVWKQALPGPGTSSPIVVGSKIFVTCYTGYGLAVDNPGEMSDLVRHVICLDRKTGKIAWSKPFPAEQPESAYRSGNDSRHGYASSTPASDGQRLYVFFGASGVYCLDLAGKVLWQADVGSGTHGWGSATSPLLYENVVIVNASVESKSLVGLDKATGKEVWRVEGIGSCWSSPMLVEAGGRAEVVLNVPKRLTAYDPRTGEELWHCEGIDDGYLCPSAISNEGVVYVNGGRKNTTLAVRAGGRGDVTDSHVLWRANIGSNVSSLVYVDGRLYGFHEKGGMAYCVDATTGEIVFQERLDPAPDLIYSSALAAAGKIYGVSQHRGTYVMAAEPEFKLLAVNTFADDDSRANASIAVSDNQLLLRTDKAIYCLGGK